MVMIKIAHYYRFKISGYGHGLALEERGLALGLAALGLD